MQTEKKAAKYEVVREVKLVRVKVPSRGSHYLNVVPGHSFETDGEMIPVPTHYRHGQKIGDTDIIVNRHFYGVTENDLGKTILATVKVVKKTIPRDGCRDVFIMLDITKEDRIDGVFPKKTLKIMPSITSSKRSDDIGIIMTNGVIRFEDYVPYTPEKFRTPAESSAAPANQ